MTDAPKSANEVLDRVMDDHAWTEVDMSYTTSQGLQRNVEYARKAVKALADYIDGKFKDDPDKSYASETYEPQERVALTNQRSNEKLPAL